MGKSYREGAAEYGRAVLAAQDGSIYAAYGIYNISG